MSLQVAPAARKTSKKTRRTPGHGPTVAAVTSMLKERMSVEQGGYHERTRRKILKVAHKLYTTAGYASVSMREVAKRMGFSAQAIYYYFPSKEAMFAGLADEGLRLLEAQHPSEELADSLDNLRLPYLRYYDFSKAHPEYFTLLWMDPVAATSQQEPQIAMIMRMSEDVNKRFYRCIREGLMPEDLDLHHAGTVLFAAVHGAAVMGLTGRPPHEAQALDLVAHRLLDAAILGLQAGLVRKPSPGDGAAAAGANPA